MSKKTMKIISVITIILCVIMAMSTCFADVTPNVIGSGTLNNAEEQSLSNIGGKIAAIIRNVAIIIAVVILMVIGIKYMMGSAEEKAEYKKVMIPYLVGAILCFAAAAIAQVVISTSQSLLPS